MLATRFTFALSFALITKPPRLGVDTSALVENIFALRCLNRVLATIFWNAFTKTTIPSISGESQRDYGVSIEKLMFGAMQ